MMEVNTKSMTGREMSRIAIKGLVVLLIFLCSLIPTQPPNNTLLANLDERQGHPAYHVILPRPLVFISIAIDHFALAMTMVVSKLSCVDITRDGLEGPLAMALREEVQRTER